MTTLDEQLIAAHSANDQTVLVSLYQQAATTAKDEQAAAFFLTHAYVLALEAGHSDASALHARLKSMGREE